MGALSEATRSDPPLGPSRPISPTVGRLVWGVALGCTGLLAGAFFYGWSTVVPAYRHVPIDVHLRFRTVLMEVNAPIMQTLMGASVLTCLALALLSQGWRRAGAAAAGAMALVSLAVTRFGNVPINVQVKRWPVQAPPANYLELLNRWDVYHSVRTAAAVLAFVLLLVVIARTAPVPPSVDASRVTSVSLWTLQIALAVFFVVSAVLKLSGTGTTVATFESIGMGQWLRYLVALLELAGAIGLVIPRAAGPAALALAGVMVGATATNLVIGGPVPLTTALFAVLILLSWGRRSQIIAAAAFASDNLRGSHSRPT